MLLHRRGEACQAQDKPGSEGYVVEAGPLCEKLPSMSGQVTKTNLEHLS